MNKHAGIKSSLRTTETGIEEGTEMPHVNSQERYIFEHNTCAMCESELEIRHEINMKELKLKEEAHCPSCGIRVRSTSHFLN
jgi:DNA-directed RNA polymerase subunit RPC12/RpoP